MRTTFEDTLIGKNPILIKANRLEEIVFHTVDSNANDSIKYIQKGVDPVEAEFLRSLIIAASKCRILEFKVLGRLWMAAPKATNQKFENSPFTEYLVKKQIIKPENLLFPLKSDLTALEMEQVYPNSAIEKIIQKGDFKKFSFSGTNMEFFMKKVSFGTAKIDMSSFVAYCGNLQLLEFMDQKGVNFTEETAQYAVRGGNLKVCQFCREKDLKFEGCLKLAVENHHNDIAKWLIQEFGPVTLDLSFCAEKFNTLAFLYFEKKGASLEANDDKGTPPFVAAGRFGNLMMLKYLVSKKVDMEARDKLGKTALIYAADNGDIETVDYLAMQNADLRAKDKEGREGIHWAAAYGQIECVKFLLESGIDINERDNYGRTPLLIAIQRSRKNIVDFLIDEGADLSAKDNNNWDASIFATHAGNLDLLKYLVENGANIEQQSSTGWNPLLRACCDGFEPIVKYLVEELNANLEARAKDGYTPIMYAAYSGYLSIVKYLYEKGASLDVVNEGGQTIADVAKRQDIKAFVKNPPINYDAF